MCQSKAQGRRCNSHLRNSCAGGVATLTAVSPLSKAETAARITRLRDVSGDTRPAAREEIDEFLNEQVIHAETCDSLNPRQKANIVARFKAAIGRLRIDKATLAAWKAVVAQAWSNVGRKLGAFVLAGALVTGIGGCGTGGEDHVPEPPSTTSTAAPQAQEFAADPTPTVAVPADVATFFGSPAKAQAAYTKAATVFMAEQMDSKLLGLDRQAAKPEDFPIRKALTPGARKYFDEKVVKGAHDEQASHDVSALSHYGAGPQIEPATLTTGVKTGVVKKRVEKPRYSMSSDGRPKITFESRGSVRLTKDGQHILSTYATLTTLWLTKDGHISGWSSDWTKIDPGPNVPDEW